MGSELGLPVFSVKKNRYWIQRTTKHCGFKLAHQINASKPKEATMLNDLATKLHREFIHNFSDEQSTSSVDANKPILSSADAVDRPNVMADSTVADDPNWMVTPPILSYGGK
jgi:hypothetical protein